jgi:O-antigen ligase
MSGSRKELHETIHFSLLAGIALSLPFSVKINSILIIVGLLNWFIEGDLLSKIKGTIRDQILLFWILLFVLHMIGIFFSEDKPEAYAIIERRLSFLIFPLLLSQQLSAERIRTIALTFAMAVISGLVFCYFKASLFYFATSESSVFFYHQFSSGIGIHAVYLAAYAVFSIHILWHYTPWEEWLLRTVSLIAIGFLTASCFLLSSKMMLAVLLIGVLTRLFMSMAITIKKKVVLGTGFLMLLISGILFLPNLKQRFDFELRTELRTIKPYELPDETNLTGTSFRLLVWKHSIEIIKQEKAWLYGVGIGDFQELLNKRYAATGMYMGNPETNDVGYKNYNPHNQYIELLLSVGIIGLMPFIFIIFYLFNRFLKYRNMLLLQLTLMLVFFSLSESVLATNKGIVFFMFFICLFNREPKPSNN